MEVEEVEEDYSSCSTQTLSPDTADGTLCRNGALDRKIMHFHRCLRQKKRRERRRERLDKAKREAREERERRRAYFDRPRPQPAPPPPSLLPAQAGGAPPSELTGPAAQSDGSGGGGSGGGGGGEIFGFNSWEPGIVPGVAMSGGGEPKTLLESSVEEGVGSELLEETSSVKIGVTDYVFYSLLLAKCGDMSRGPDNGENEDWLAMIAAFVSILVGLCVTLIYLSIRHKPLPAIPISVCLGLLMVYGTHSLLRPFSHSTSLKQVYF